MTKLLVRSIPIFLLFGVIAAPSTDARGRKKKATPTPQGIVISSIGANTITVSEGNTSKTVTVTQFTEITVNGRRATFADLKPGMIVDLGLSSPTQASRITATDAPAGSGSKK